MKRFFTKKTILIVLLIIIAGAIVLSLTLRPSNPPVENAVKWDSPQTEALFNRACADCHSNETVWPLYSKIPPVSWLVIHDVNDGREKFNISAKDMGKADEAAEQVTEGEMPPWQYLPMHSQAKLTPAEKRLLATGLQKTFGSEN